MNVLKQTGWVLLELLVCVLLFVGFVFGGMALLNWISPNLATAGTEINESSSPFKLFFSTGFLLVFIGSILVSLVDYKFIFKKDISLLGFSPKQAFPFFGKGWLGAAVLIFIGFLLMLVFQQIKFLPISFKPGYFLGFLLFFVIQSTAEEIMTRSFLIPTIEARLGTWVAVLISGSLFAIMHIANDNFTWVGFLNILLGGFIMALLFVKFRNLWICAGFHTGWNFTQATLLDFNVSGIDTYSLVQFQDTGFERISGGAFGYEGSLLAVCLQAIALYLLFTYYQFEFKPVTILPPKLVALEEKIEAVNTDFTNMQTNLIESNNESTELTQQDKSE